MSGGFQAAEIIDRSSNQSSPETEIFGKTSFHFERKLELANLNLMRRTVEKEIARENYLQNHVIDATRCLSDTVEKAI